MSNNLLDSLPDDLSIYTIGHSDHETPAFVDLLRRHEIVLVVGVHVVPEYRANGRISE